MEFIVKKPPKITLTKEADYFEIRNISENSSPIDTKKFIVNDSLLSKLLNLFYLIYLIITLIHIKNILDQQLFLKLVIYKNLKF